MPVFDAIITDRKAREEICFLWLSIVGYPP